MSAVPRFDDLRHALSFLRSVVASGEQLTPEAIEALDEVRDRGRTDQDRHELLTLADEVRLADRLLTELGWPPRAVHAATLEERFLPLAERIAGLASRGPAEAQASQVDHETGAASFAVEAATAVSSPDYPVHDADRAGVLAQLAVAEATLAVAHELAGIRELLTSGSGNTSAEYAAAASRRR